MPEDWKREGSYLSLSFVDYRAENNLYLFYYILSVPRTAEDSKRLVSKFLNKGFLVEDYSDLKDIFREYNGIKTGNKKIKKFVENQIWFGKEVQHAIPEDVIEAMVQAAGN